MSQYVALLRGINVGGNNLIKMPALKQCFEKQGFSDVVTYIQSGNVLFSAPDAKAAQLTDRIEKALCASFDYEASLVVRSKKQLAEIVERAPKGFGTEPEKYRYDVIFFMDPTAAAKTIDMIPWKEGVDTAHLGPGVLYFSRLIAKASSTRLTKIMELPVYKRLTIRNWNTTTKLLAMMTGQEVVQKASTSPKRRASSTPKRA